MNATVPLSVVIPAYNYARFLPDCLRSVAAQDVPGLEVLVVDDGSTDDTAAVVAAHPGVRYLHQENRGLSAARNRGLAETHGELVLFLDADDLLAPASLGPRRDFLLARPDCQLAVCRNRQFSTPPGQPPRPGAPWHLARNRLAERLCHANIAPPHAFLGRRTLLERLGGFDTGLRACEDYDFWLRALAAGAVPVHCPRGLVYYRKHAASMSADDGNQLRHDALLAERVLAWLVEGDGAARLGTRAALLAAWAGVARVLARLASHAPLAAARARLLAAAHSRLAASVTLAGALPARRDPLALYYARIILQHPPAPADELAIGLRALVDLVDGGTTGAWAPFARDAGLDAVDRYRLARQTLSSLRRA